MEHLKFTLKIKKEKTLQSPMKLWGPGERHRPLGLLFWKQTNVIQRLTKNWCILFFYCLAGNYVKDKYMFARKNL